MRQIIVFLILLFINSNVHAVDEFVESFIVDVTKISVNSFCNDQKTLKYINMNNANCQQYIKSLSSDCNLSLKIVLPGFEDYEVEKTKINKIKHLSLLYFLCIKSRIYESIENIELLDYEAKNWVD